MKSLYKTPESKLKIARLYQEKLDSLELKYVMKNIKTSYGETNIVICGDLNKPAALVLPGANAGAPVALETLAQLKNDYCLYVLDVIGQPALSAETRPSLKDLSYGIWVKEVTENLGLSEFTIIGISFGGFISLKTIATIPDRIKKAFLIVPVGIINANPLGSLFGIYLPLFMLTKRVIFLQKFMKALFTEEDQFAKVFLHEVLLNFKQDFSSIPLIPKDLASTFKIPIYIIAGDEDKFFPGKSLLKRSKEIFPSLQKHLLLKNSRHVPSILHNTEITKFILDNQ